MPTGPCGFAPGGFGRPQALSETPGGTPAVPSALTVYAQSTPCDCRLLSIVGNMEEKCFLEDPRPDLKSSFFEEVAWLPPFSLHYFAVSRGAGSRLSCSSAPPWSPWVSLVHRITGPGALSLMNVRRGSSQLPCRRWVHGKLLFDLAAPPQA